MFRVREYDWDSNAEEASGFYEEVPVKFPRFAESLDRLKAEHQEILSELEIRRSWQQAVKLVLSSLEPLGSAYCGELEKGLNGGWCDRFPNQGKQSGAFSCGTFDGDPYILMNYQPEVLDAFMDDMSQQGIETGRS